MGKNGYFATVKLKFQASNIAVIIKSGFCVDTRFDRVINTVSRMFWSNSAQNLVIVECDA